MKPHEFLNCEFREASLFANSYIKEKINKTKENIGILEVATDKLISMYPYMKNSKYISIRKVFKSLFKDDKDIIEKENFSIVDMEVDDKRQFILDLQKELKERGEL